MKNAICAVAGALAGLAIQAAGMQLTLVALLSGWDGPFSGGPVFAAVTLLVFLLPTGVCAGAVARRYLFLVPALVVLAVGWETYIGTGSDLVDAAGHSSAMEVAGGIALLLWAALALAAGIVQGCRISWRAWPKPAAKAAA
ncbi:hypothetical protein SAMN04487939_102125 [Lysobacter sp. yr284]|uniref:hypothetical protein n=1 Tax=Lysobacter sp. yr284 TaxID=1761791 RepID=UPI00089BA831|nr:hypothetical protein [Lysobacter sp. yr284]SDY43461.1 hypothetical protein SAMN04487939_102125 [Lysobacter sp. yr284]